MKSYLKKIYGILFFFIVIITIQSFGIFFLNKSNNSIENNSLKQDLRSSEIFNEEEDEFLMGTMDNVTISENGYLSLKENYSEITWGKLYPSTKPSARRSPSMVYHSNSDKVILFGGDNGTYNDETWTYDLASNTWTNMSPATKPSARYYHSMVYNSKYDKVILFGGYGATDYSNETWIFTGNRYYQQGSFKSNLIYLNDIYKIIGDIVWNPVNQLDNTSIQLQIGISNTAQDEDFIFTDSYNSSFTFEGIGRNLRYRIIFKSDISQYLSPYINSVNIYLTLGQSGSLTSNDSLTNLEYVILLISLTGILSTSICTTIIIIYYLKKKSERIPFEARNIKKKL